jgi:hypothetical protein
VNAIENLMKSAQPYFQLIWGAALTAAGIGVFAILPHRMEQIRQLRQAEPYAFDMLFLWFCFGLLGVLLIGGGVRKIYSHFRNVAGSQSGNHDRK